MNIPSFSLSRTRLRQPRVEDAPAYLRLWTEPSIVAFTSTRPDSLDGVRARLEQMLARMQNRELLAWALVDASDSVIGSLGFHNIVPANRAAELAYELHPAFWNQGIMHEAAHAILPVGFGEANLHRIAAHIEPENSRSIRLVGRLGFRYEGTMRESFRRGDRFVDTAVYARLATDR